MTAELRRRKRELFEDTHWKPWGFNADSLKDENVEQHNSCWSFLTFLSKGAPGTGPILAVYQHLGHWNPLFNLTANYDGCAREAIEFTGLVTFGNLKGSTKKAHSCWYMLCEQSFGPRPLLNLKNMTSVETPTQIPVLENLTCVCNNGIGQFMGHSQCYAYVTGHMKLQMYDKGGMSQAVDDTADQNITMNIGDTRVIVNNSLRYHVGLGIGFMYSNYWQCGNDTYEMLPTDWSGCCYLVKLQVHNIVMLRGTESYLNIKKRSTAQFHTIQSYHWRISLGEKWGIGILPWYGVTFLADHIDNITYSMSTFANETIKGFDWLTDNDKSHRLILLKHEMALDFLMARTG
ncbi:uncharacterized protein LOC115370519 [Scomber scombrus]|uniref:Uncharacterized protein LOC115370519 n=1 Tax=Scomber scombrus TaxID=13677 RepID=A0AAV1Q001_SCOSC